ncbi:MAG TPA: DUF4124 domain-containing protein [Steroidobacteraceae bacterium]|nr:DUF4124 domain-containing protein [Steroidobacteraceae bacterium]
MLRSLAFIAALVLSAAASAAVYKWIDAQGNIHYSDRPPSETIEAQVINIDSRPSNRERVAVRRSASQQQSQSTAQADGKQRAEQATQQAVNSDVAKSRAKQCEEAKTRYQTAVESHKLYKLGKNGEREYLSDTELSQARLDARRNLDESCGSSAS